MKRIVCILLVLFIALSGCSPKNDANDSWKEQYDLGVRYLSEGNYAEAIISFDKAIKIDPKQPMAYVGRADAHIGSGETDDNLAVAFADYTAAIELDETNANAWLGLVDVYIRQGEFGKARETLQVALEKTNHADIIADKLAEVEKGMFVDRNGKPRRTEYYENGILIEYWINTYDENGNNILTENYNADSTINYTEVCEFNEQGLEVKSTLTHSSGGVHVIVYEYDSHGRCIKESVEMNFPGEKSHMEYSIISYDETLRTKTNNRYDGESGKLINCFVIEHDENWVRQKGSRYLPDTQGNLYLDYYVEYIWSEDGVYGGYNHFQVANH